ncbi:hypothetical protein FB45DRAFT_781080 [Roridomyces roridus]|uniref:DUF7918 domain-containing protein n=1 Tax=Roridomyces roridus TaxID=1738132 RepID=A0AAD7CE66_9AGAR|nr:hypothetical protein FB45DRAFT_781080 [Roridomyces roridus]
MLQSKDFTAWISIDGLPLPCHNIETSENQQNISCYIPSEVGKPFSVHWCNVSAPGLTGGGVTVDGHRCGFEAIAAETRPIEASMDGIAETETLTRPFVFAPMELTDDDTYLDSPGVHPSLGLIKLEIWRVDVTGGAGYAYGGAPAAVAVPTKQKVHERTKKGEMNQQIGFGASVQHAQVQSAQIRRVGAGPLVTFSFKYRSLDILRANGIAPKPEPSRPLKRRASESPERDEEADETEAKEIKERLNALNAKRAKKTDSETVKTEPGKVNVKLERP